ncbi:MAG: T9SS C-terminal target domain-containing protein [Bacteroidetes bacterium]|nr:T9SS C-terminal target domain-containing protein [Bacteroidota bacterium]
MKNILRLTFLSLFLVAVAHPGMSREVIKKTGTKSTNSIKSTTAGCQPGSAYKYLDINNVRTLIYSYGNMWFLENAEYEIPKGSRKMSMFSASLWIGGIDVNNNLKLAAYKFGQGPTGGPAHTKNDFWPGPLSIDGNAAVDEETCAKHDKLYPITRAEVNEYLAWWNSKDEFPNYVIPNSIKEWPAHGDASKNQAKFLAPFFDRAGDYVYDPEDGDYPYYDLANELCPRNLKPGERIKRAPLGNGGPTDTLGILVDQVIKGDQTLWSVFNDKGGFHSETEGEPIGMEIRGQAFAFATNDEINNMTFYSFELINRSTFTLTGTYFSQWVDPDLGFAEDDYVGCDVGRGLGYCYNGNPVDGTGQVQAYGAHPPAVGVDFFQGPYVDPDGYDNPAFRGSNAKGPSFLGSCNIVALNNTMHYMEWGTGSGEVLVMAEAINGINFGDGIIDNERFGMRRFVYHNNPMAGVPLYMGDPDYAPEYYLFLRGIWKDNVKMQYGGNAHPTAGGYGPNCDFMFPGDSDICDWGTNGQPPNGPRYWTEETANNNPRDRRFMQSAGPFTLQPGACNYITVGIPWARAISGTPFESVELLRIVDDLCQSLFDNCFAVLNGPNAPDITIEELDKELIIYLTNRKTNDAGNNYQEKYVEFDPNIPNPEGQSPRNDSLYRFEGYQIYQFKDATVSIADLNDQSKARLVAQCDIKNGITKLVNWTFDQSLGGNKGEVMVDGTDRGIKHAFRLTEDAFATGDKRLINHKQYYFTVVAYAYNEFKKYDPLTAAGLDGQKIPYLRGRSNIKTYTAIPHISVGQYLQSAFGDGPRITRIQGQGNGGMILDMTQATIAEILSKPPADSLNQYGGPNYPISYNPEYKNGMGPLNVKVIDPLNVVKGEFTVKLDSMKAATSDYFINSRIKFGKWTLTDNSTGISYRSDTTTIYPYEQLFLDLGLALTVNQVPYPGDTLGNGSFLEENGLIWAPSALYNDSTNLWLSGVPDNDVPASAANWIRSGTYKGDEPAYYDWNMGADEPWDPNNNYEKIQGGTWAPYGLCAYADQQTIPPTGLNKVGPAYNKISKENSTMDNLCSVDIVFTPDKQKWTRCVVIEMCPNDQLSQGNAKQFSVRKAPSVNVDGLAGEISADPLYNSNYIDSVGMSWFPGYAINLETGERLNIIFSENSWLVGHNGRDMIFNPSANVYDVAGNPVFGGQHYVYIMNHISYSSNAINLDFPAYDAGSYIRKTLLKTPSSVYWGFTYASAAWVGMPLSVEDEQWLGNQVTIKIRVAKPYQPYYSMPLPVGSTDTLNKNNPVYTFSTDGIETVHNSVEKGKTDLDLVNVVPNPYYAYSDYERNQLDNRIKITNLPEKCTVTIYDVSGTLIRQFKVDKGGVTLPRSSTLGLNTEAKTSIDWDLKNFAGIPISGGVFLIHVKADGLGERTLKWFGILRPVDLNSF